MEIPDQTPWFLRVFSIRTGTKKNDGFQSHGGYPNSWLVYNTEHPTKIRMITRGTPKAMETPNFVNSRPGRPNPGVPQKPIVPRSQGVASAPGAVGARRAAPKRPGAAGAGGWME